MIGQANDNTDDMMGLYGECYRWIRRSEVVLDEDALFFKTAPPFGFEDDLGGHFVLQLHQWKTPKVVKKTPKGKGKVKEEQQTPT